MSSITAGQVSLNQGQDHKDRMFGYVAGDGGGFFFTWMDTLDETVDSVESDGESGDGDLRRADVQEFLRDYLPTTRYGRGWDV